MEEWYGDNKLPELFCEDRLDGVPHIRTTLGKFGTGTSEWFPMEYSCSTDDGTEKVEQMFTRYCEAIPKIANTHFHCNEMADNTSFDAFLDEVEDVQCASGAGSYKRNSSIKNEIRISNLSPEQTAKYTDMFGSNIISGSFNPPDNVLIVVYEVVTETASPTLTPTHSLAPSAAPTSSALPLSSSSLLIAGLVLICLAQ